MTEIREILEQDKHPALLPVSIVDFSQRVGYRGGGCVIALSSFELEKGWGMGGCRVFNQQTQNEINPPFEAETGR